MMIDLWLIEIVYDHLIPHGYLHDLVPQPFRLFRSSHSGVTTTSPAQRGAAWANPRAHDLRLSSQVGCGSHLVSMGYTVIPPVTRSILDGY